MTAKGLISPDELQGMVRAVDAEDGDSDGKFKGDIL